MKIERLFWSPRFVLACAVAMLWGGSLAHAGHYELRNNYHAYLFVASAALTASEMSDLSFWEFYSGGEVTDVMDAMDYYVTAQAYFGGMLPDWDGVDRSAAAVLSTSWISAGEHVRDYLSGLNLDPDSDVISIYNRNNQFLTRWNAPTMDEASIAAGDFSQSVNAVIYDENGFPIGASGVWTGSNADGTSTGANANDWTSGSALATYGDVTAVGAAAFNAGELMGNTRNVNVYGLLVFRTPDPEMIAVWVPEPGTWALGVTGLLSFAVVARRRHARREC